MIVEAKWRDSTNLGPHTILKRLGCGRVLLENQKVREACVWIHDNVTILSQNCARLVKLCEAVHVRQDMYRGR